MPYQKHIPQFAACSAMLIALSGCCLMRPNPLNEQLSASQLRSQELFAERSELDMAQAGLQQNFAGAQQQNQFLAEQLGQTQNQLATANTRIDNLLAERGELKTRYAGRLLDTASDPLMTAAVTGSLPGFQRDELTGLNRFPEAIHFDLGSAELRPESLPILKEFANQVNSGSAKGLRVLIVGHTDDQPIANRSTARQHPTNWHLSTDRADQVITVLEQLGVEPERIAAMGYSKFQPLENGTAETSRQRNRRVEMYIAPEAANVAFWDPVGSLN
jgi:chemotaxis protein MotB